VVLVVADMARSTPVLTGAFVAEFTRRLQGRSSTLAMPMTWIEQSVAGSGRTIEELVQGESQQEAADQVSISNSIASLRFLANMDWREFVETLSLVDQTLREDPAGIYGLMDFSTRDTYRHVVEKIAKRSGARETDVAATVLQLARAHADTTQAAAHVGYFLVDDGLARTKAAIAAADASHRPVRLRPRRIPLPLYLAPIAVIAALFTYALLSSLFDQPVPLAVVIACGVLAAIVFSEMGIALVNWAAAVLVAPQPLPRLDYSAGIPSRDRTLVVVPCMFGSIDAVDALAEALEVRFLANRDPHLHFALLSDFLDADVQLLPGDEALLAHAAEQIERLNARYAPGDGDRFFLMHRARSWNVGEGKWIGPERKRGKLASLNRLLRPAAHPRAADGFMRLVGATGVLVDVRYVITLDSDTRLPRDAARELVGTLAHPLNRARFDATRRCVTRGYGILQPGVGSSMGGRRASRYARMYGSEPGIDPYSRAVSDVYQDLFGEGSFVGKGIYDFDAFEYALDGRFPENRVLSHDLLEGCYARAGLVSDVQLFEDYPARYLADVKRRYRWIRGDWQLLSWLLPRVPRMQGGYERNPLSWLSRGKLLDNLRRSLVPAAATALLVGGWMLLSQPLSWTLLLLSPLFLPLLIPAMRDVLSKPADLALESHLVQVGKATARQLQRALVNLACLPYEACFSVSAICARCGGCWSADATCCSGIRPAKWNAGWAPASNCARWRSHRSSPSRRR
jgi:hypothetical protein